MLFKVLHVNPVLEQVQCLAWPPPRRVHRAAATPDGLAFGRATMEMRGIITLLWAMIASWDRLSSNSKLKITAVSGLVDETSDAVPEYRLTTKKIHQNRILQVACIDEDPQAS